MLRDDKEAMGRHRYEKVWSLLRLAGGRRGVGMQLQINSVGKYCWTDSRDEVQNQGGRMEIVEPASI